MFTPPASALRTHALATLSRPRHPRAPLINYPHAPFPRVHTHHITRYTTTTTTSSSTQPRSLPSRLVRGLLGYTALTLFAFTTGAIVAVAFLPNKDAIKSILNAQPVSDAASLTSYTPPDAATAAINTRILSSAVATALRANPSFHEARPHLKIPDAAKPASLTSGVLAGPGRIAVPPLVFTDDGHTTTQLFYLGPQLAGHPGLIHGGLLATLLDEGLARCCFPAMPNKMGVTAGLTITYRRPVRVDGFYMLRAQTVKIDGRKAWVKGWIEELVDGDGEGAGLTGAGEKLVEAEALYIEPRNAGVMMKLYANVAGAQ